MKQTILRELERLEAAENVRILYAAESGSRAWGFASPDSDYDVRFLYVRRPEDYLKLSRPRDVIEWRLDQTLDINGWDIQKALRLLGKSNPTLFEWAGSPIVYRTTPSWELMQPTLQCSFSSKAGMYHYLSMAAKNYREYLKGDLVRMKKYLYVLRPILACKWVREYGTPPPMLFDRLVQTQLEPELVPLVEQLLRYKRSAPEGELMPRVDALNRYIEQNLQELTDHVRRWPENTSAGEVDLDTLFLSILDQAWQPLSPTHTDQTSARSDPR